MPTMMTNMSPNTESFFDNCPTVRAILRSVVRWHGNCDHAKHFTKILNPCAKSRPSCIANRFSQMSIFDHVTHLQILIGYQVVRLDYTSRQLHGEIFTLPTYFKVFSRQLISKLDSVFRPFFGLGHTTRKPFQRLLAIYRNPSIFIVATEEF
jgi:hypothetical protein